jgi:hypothetical protein
MKSKANKNKAPTPVGSGDLLGDCSLADLRDMVERANLLARLDELGVRNKGDVLDGKKSNRVIIALDLHQAIIAGHQVNDIAGDLKCLSVFCVDDVCLHKILTVLKSPNEKS